MKYIFIDLEMQPIEKKYKEERTICRQEIIEIGAVAFDESHSEISSFKRYIRPQYSVKISRTIYELTGITDGLLFGSNTISAELDSFAEWCHSFDDEYKVYAWSENDLNQITSEYRLKNIEMSSMLLEVTDNWFDLQLEYDSAAGSSRPTSLTHALESVGIYFEGRMHDALDDARNTATIFKELSDPEEFKRSLNFIRNYNSTPTSSGTTLGDLIDFSALGFEF